ncbi:hypothetical protein NQ317_000739 [Molorchus minor]|uniref:Uncharacterized protein n=1 Tax=Molorchus minor TaxID=1323400 RepID=A0ABQ9JBL4_9CUCU|nr:hypothetical protein NQ317_000739 [Molorchus minor]
MPVITRTKKAEMEESIKQFMDMMREMKSGQDEMKMDIKQGQEEMKQGQDAIKEEMKQGQDAIKEIKQCQDEMRTAQEAMKSEVTRQLQDQGNKIDQQVSEILTNMKTEIHTRLEYMEKVVEETVEEFKNEMDKEITDMKKDVEVLNNKIDNGLVDVELLNNKIDNGLVAVKKEIDILKPLIVSLRGDALEILQTLNEDQHKNYEDLVLQLEMRFVDKHLQQVYQAQLKGRNQRINENLQQYEADIARLVYLAYPTAPRDFIEQLAVQVFIDAYALEFEAAKEASRGHTRIRQIRTRTPEREYRSNNSYNRSNFKDDVENLRQNIKDIQDVIGEPSRTSGPKKPDNKPRCPRLGSEQAPVQRQVEDQENAN